MSKHNLQTLVDVLRELKDEGYTSDFKYENNKLKVLGKSEGKLYSSADIKVNKEYRFEGESDPADSSILYVIETNDGLKGTIVDSYGADTFAELGQFILEADKPGS